jgi:hypothetical protein
MDPMTGRLRPAADGRAAGGAGPAWDRLGRLAAAQSAALSAPSPAAPGLCRTCFGPAGAGRPHCFQCDLHRQCAPGSLASAVLPAAYAVKGGPHARRLWMYKSGRPGAAAARRALLVLLLVVLREHGPCLWRRAGGDAGRGGPTHLAVVPSGRGRAGAHPLRVLAEPYLRLPWAGLAARPGTDGRARDLDPGRFTAPRLAGARVLLLDDTWTTGASVQSAAMALRGAGASAVAAVVLGRHLVRPADGAVAFAPGQCALHRPAG